MSDLRIFCDAHFDEANLKLLRDGIAPHQLILPAGPGTGVLGVAPIDPALLEADVALGQTSVEGVLGAKKLRWLQITSAGFTRYDTDAFRAAAKERGLAVTNSSSVFAEACAEHVFAFMMAQARQLPAALESGHSPGGAKLSSWDEIRRSSTCLVEGEVVILGYGAIAARLVELLAPFRMKITGMRRKPRGDESISMVTPEKLAPVLASADHVVSVLPANDETTHFVSSEFLAKMKPGAVFYNIGRGATVDQTALADALNSERLGAAWLDVTEPEPLPVGHPLLSARNCHITPHTAGGHFNEAGTLVRHFVSNFQRFIRNEPLRDRIM